MAGSCKCGDEPLASDAMELVSYLSCVCSLGRETYRCQKQ
jgi:hypothetical protein